MICCQNWTWKTCPTNSQRSPRSWSPARANGTSLKWLTVSITTIRTRRRPVTTTDARITCKRNKTTSSGGRRTNRIPRMKPFSYATVKRIPLWLVVAKTNPTTSLSRHLVALPVCNSSFSLVMKFHPNIRRRKNLLPSISPSQRSLLSKRERISRWLVRSAAVRRLCWIVCPPQSRDASKTQRCQACKKSSLEQIHGTSREITRFSSPKHSKVKITAAITSRSFGGNSRWVCRTTMILIEIRCSRILWYVQ